MIKISLVGQTKVNTLKKRFKNDFGLGSGPIDFQQVK